MTKDNGPAWRKLALAVIGCCLAAGLAACAGHRRRRAVGGRRTGRGRLLFSWSAESDCGACHENDVASFEDPACAASSHADLESQCLTCHNDEPGLQEAHEGVSFDSEKRRATLKKTEVPDDTCLGCHDIDELKAATADSAVLTTTRAPWSTRTTCPQTPTHEGAGISCSSCHKVHTAEGAAQTAPTVCKNLPPSRCLRVRHLPHMSGVRGHAGATAPSSPWPGRGRALQYQRRVKRENRRPAKRRKSAAGARPRRRPRRRSSDNRQSKKGLGTLAGHQAPNGASLPRAPAPARQATSPDRSRSAPRSG